MDRACRAGTDLVTMWRTTAALLAVAVPHFESPCFFTVDPDSLLTTSHFQEGLPEIPADWLGREYLEPDFNSMTEVLASREGFGTLHDATGGRPELASKYHREMQPNGCDQGFGTLHDATGGRPELASKYHREMQPNGCDQELVVALRTRDGETWGALGLYREAGRPLFAGREIDVVRAAAPMLAEGARHALLSAQAAEPDLPDAPGLVVLDDDLTPVSMSPTARAWLHLLGGDATSLPPSVMAVAGTALGPNPASGIARVATDRGVWLTLQGARLDGAATPQAAVVIESAQPHHLAAILMRAHGLTDREQQVTRLVMRGASTTAAARELAIAEDTVQKHLQSAFGKTGARSRGELVSVLFQTHYEPRVRDNERRTASQRPSRHGPVSVTTDSVR